VEREGELRIVVGARFSSCAAALIPDLKGSRSILVVRCEKMRFGMERWILDWNVWLAHFIQ
jgi:hypothetical protein